MKIKNGFVLRKMGDSFIGIYAGDGADPLSGMIKLNETAAFIWSALEKDCREDALVEAVVNEYNIDRDKAESGVEKVVSELLEAGVLE